jgi:hypothetical protein
MQVTYELTADDFRHAIIAHRNRNSLFRWAMRLVAFFWMLALVAQCYSLFAGFDRSRLSSSFNVSFLGFVVFPYIQWGAPYFSARRQFRNSPSSQGKITLEVQDAGLRFRSATTDGSVSWKNYIRWIEDKYVFVLFPSPVIFVVVPKRAFAADQLGWFRETLREQVPGPHPPSGS